MASSVFFPSCLSQFSFACVLFFLSRFLSFNFFLYFFLVLSYYLFLFSYTFSHNFFILLLTFSFSALSRFLPNIYPLPFSLYARLSLFFCFSHCLFFSVSSISLSSPYISLFFLLLLPSFTFSITLVLFFSLLLFFLSLSVFLSIFLFLSHCLFFSFLLSLPYVFFFFRFNLTFFSSPFLSILHWHTSALSLSLSTFLSHDYRRELNKEKKKEKK